jgi:hypothetical protein
LIAILLALTCGVGRQPVKDLLDSPHLQRAGVATVEQLAALRPPRWRSAAPRSAQERQVVEVTAMVLRYHREADQDLHLVLQGSTGTTMIAELPAPACTIGSPYAAQMKAARTRFLRLFRPGVRLRLTGVVFFDKAHRQDGVARNGVELHPLLAVEPARP